MKTKAIHIPDHFILDANRSLSWRVLVMSGPDRGEGLFLENGIVKKIGRFDGNDLILQDDAISKFHLEMKREEKEITLRDDQSTNGTYIKEKDGTYIDIRKRGGLAIVSVGAEILIGQTRLRILSEPKERLLIGKSQQIKQVYEQIQSVSGSHANVLICGETGAGKELAAREIHWFSTRFDAALVTHNCAASSKELIESELFGHQKGAFTGATDTRKGLFELAKEGTLFLDEIGELPLDLQSKLLRVLQEKRVKRVGGEKEIPLDFRVIAATNRSLEEEVVRERFRRDLFYRLSVLRVAIPPLRERKGDIPLLVDHFCTGESVEISAKAMEKLMAYSWPGNVRELQNTLQRAMAKRKGDVIADTDIVFDSTDESAGVGSLNEVKKKMIQETLQRYPDNMEKAAKILGISLSGLYKKKNLYGL
jgi:transcriptional regulator with PAS, ATPase and Fis domain